MGAYMTKNTADDFKALIKEERKKLPTPFDVSYKAFIDLGLSLIHI